MNRKQSGQKSGCPEKAKLYTWKRLEVLVSLVLAKDQLLGRQHIRSHFFDSLYENAPGPDVLFERCPYALPARRMRVPPLAGETAGEDRSRLRAKLDCHDSDSCWLCAPIEHFVNAKEIPSCRFGKFV
jgi:hypothetical protein